MKLSKKNVTLVIVIIAIVAAIFFLDNLKIGPNGISQKKIIYTNETSITMAKAAKYPRAIELVSPDGYINTKNISISENIGKNVILLDFWDYSCINCQRTFPYLTSWYSKYKDQGLIIIGIHTPEFQFEQNYDNVKMATEKYNIMYPVVLDNNYQTWQAYNNQYWPREYLIDIDGFIVHDNIGEGNYDETEQAIQKALRERAVRLGLSQNISNNLVQPNMSSTDLTKIGSPEMYLGYQFSRGQLGNSEGYVRDKIVDYELPKAFSSNIFYMGGNWLNNNDNLESIDDNGTIVVRYSSKSINIVAGSDKPINVLIYIDDLFAQNITISNYGLYNLYMSADYGQHILKLITPGGLKAYTFTFG